MSSAPALEAAGPSAHNTNGALQPDPATDIPPSLGAFQSLLPLVDDLLRLVAAQAAGTEPADGVIIKVSSPFSFIYHIPSIHGEMVSYRERCEAGELNRPCHSYLVS